VQGSDAHSPQFGDDFTPQTWVDAMESLLHEQEGILTSLVQLSGRQQECISSGDVDDLLKVLGSRQELVTRFLDVQADLTSLKKMMDDQSMAIDEEVQTRLHDQMQSLDLLLQDVLARDVRDHTAMLQQREAVEHRVNQLDAGVRARARYASSSSLAAASNIDQGARA